MNPIFALYSKFGNYFSPLWSDVMKNNEIEIRTSVSISNEIASLEKVAAEAASALNDLATQDDAMLLAGDDAADKHDQKKTALKRAIRRTELRLAELRPLFVATKEQEEKIRLTERQRNATPAVEALRKRFNAEYLEPAAGIRNPARCQWRQRLHRDRRSQHRQRYRYPDNKVRVTNAGSD